MPFIMANITNPLAGVQNQGLPDSLANFSPWTQVGGSSGGSLQGSFGGTSQFAPTQFAGGYNLNYTPGQNGYEGSYSLGSPVQNPYQASIQQGEQQMQGYENNYNTQMPGMTQQLGQMNQAGQNYATQSSAYPSYPNSAGAGSQTAGQPEQQQANINPTTGGTYGLTPWSLVGEANTRGA
jgi:hypothetical protein